jgi:transcriptional regulator with XRE-family HTH domain
MQTSAATLIHRVVHELLREERKRAGLRQSDLAERLGQPQSFVSKYESGERRLDIAELYDVCAALGITLQEFVRLLERRLTETP